MTLVQYPISLVVSVTVVGEVKVFISVSETLEDRPGASFKACIYVK